MSQCFLLLGSNQGNKSKHLEVAQLSIILQIGQKIAVSSVYETSAWGKENQEDFLNQVLCIDTRLTPENVLSQCLSIEKEMGRVRCERWGERLIDIDILYFDDIIWESKLLTIPHPEIRQRRFTLVPLVEIAPDYIHSIFKQSNRQLLEGCKDELKVEKYNYTQQKPI